MIRIGPQLHVTGNPKFPGPSWAGEMPLLVRKSCGLRSSWGSGESLPPEMLRTTASLGDRGHSGPVPVTPDTDPFLFVFYSSMKRVFLKVN